MKKAKKIRVGVLLGGRSAEHEVSIVSARSVMAALDKKKYEVIPIGISKEGHWLVGERVVNLLESGTKIPRQLAQILPADPMVKSLVPLVRSSKREAKGTEIDVIFPVLHGTFGEDGTVQGLLELANIPYVGAGVLGSAVGMDKIVQKMIFQANHLPTPDFVYTTSHYYKRAAIKFHKQVGARIGYPCFVKPPNLGSSVGISKAHNQTELVKAIKLALQYDRRVIVEQGIEQAWEIECAVLGNEAPKASIAGRVITSNEFYDYDAKYVDGKSQLVIPAPLPKEVMAKVRNLAAQAFTTLDLAGMARVDFLVQPRKWKIYLSEVNTIPGFTSISMYPKLWSASGLPYPKLLDELIKLALERFKIKSRLTISYQPKSLWYR
ncbi:MAG: D-alanine--D-alanine ligase family protein [Patescibacteria group bacterium]